MTGIDAQRFQRRVTATIAPGQRWLVDERHGSVSCEILRPAPTHKGQWMARFHDGQIYRLRPSVLVRQMGKKEVTTEEFFADHVIAAAVRAANAATIAKLDKRPK